MSDISPWIIILSLASALLTVYSIGIGWIVNRGFKLIDDLREEDKLIKDQMTNGYVRRDDYLVFQREMLQTMRRIEDDLKKIMSHKDASGG
jgi:hypothetical protein